MDPILSGMFILAVLLAPMPFGGNIPPAWAASAFIAGVIVIVLAVKNLVLRRPFAVPLGWIRLPALLFALVCLWALVQSLGFTPASWHNPLWSAASDAFGEPLSGAISVNPYETRITLMRLMTYGAVFWLALQFGRETRQAEIMILALAAGIAAYALYALVLWSIASDTLLWYPKLNKGQVTSTFVNRNSFATFAGIGAVLFLGITGRELRRLLYRMEEERFKYRLERVINGLAGKTGLYLLGLITTLGALFLTQSRAGFFASLTALAVLSGLMLRRSPLGKLGLGLAAILALGAIVAAFHMSGEHISMRLATSELGDESRSAVYARLIQAIADYPLLGTGLGSFPDIFPLYRDETLSAFGRWDKGHNTYLELMMELGVPAALMLFAAIGLIMWRCLAGALTRQRDSHIPLIAFAASLLAATHSLFDFSLQIPGLTIVYAALLGLGVAQSWSSRLQ